MRCAPAFHDVMTPSRVLLMIASSEDSTMAASSAVVSSGAAARAAPARDFGPLLSRFREPDRDRLLATLHATALAAAPAAQRPALAAVHGALHAPARRSSISWHCFLLCR